MYRSTFGRALQKFDEAEMIFLAQKCLAGNFVETG